MDRNESILLGLDAGTSVIKCVAFTPDGELLASSSCDNQYDTNGDGEAVQNMHRTRDQVLSVIVDLINTLGDRANDIIALSVTGQGDGMWLVDETGSPLHDGWLWLDSRSSDIVNQLERSPRYARLYEITGTALNAAQARSQILWMEQHQPNLLDKAATCYHCKDYLYQVLTGKRATDPSEGLFTFGDFRAASYSNEAIELLGLSHRQHLLPDIIDGIHTSSQLLEDVAIRTGLPSNTRVCLAYIDVMCSALGGGLYAQGSETAMTLFGTTGVHMRYAPSAENIKLPADRTGYTIAFPGGGFAQLQTNMSATMNLDWLTTLIMQTAELSDSIVNESSLLETLDEKVLSAKPAQSLYHPYISTAGERGPFFNADARASILGLDQHSGITEIARAVYEGICFAARDCYTELGEVPAQIRISGGGARSKALTSLLATIMDRPVRTVEREEAGAAGAAMIAAVNQGFFNSIDECVKTWVDPAIGKTTEPDKTLTEHYDRMFTEYVATRKQSERSWQQLSRIRSHFNQHSA